MYVSELLVEQWDKVLNKQQTACEALETFKIKSRTYMKNMQRKEHEVRTTIKKSAIKILEPNSGHTESEKTQQLGLFMNTQNMNLLDKLYDLKVTLGTNQSPLRLILVLRHTDVRPQS